MTEPEAESVREVLTRTGQDVAELLRAELELAKSELRQETRTAIVAASAPLIGLAMVLVAVIVLVWAAAWALALVLPTPAAFAIVGAVLLLVGLMVCGPGIARLRSLEPLPRTRAAARRAIEELT